MSTPGDSIKRTSSVSNAESIPAIKRQRILPPTEAVNLVDIPPELLLLILGYVYDSMNPWDFIESSVFGSIITAKTLRDVDWEQVVTTLKNNGRVRDFVPCHFILFIPEIPDSEYFALQQGSFVGDLLKDTIDILAMMTQLTSFSLIAKDGKVQQIIPQEFRHKLFPGINDLFLALKVYTHTPQLADLLQSFPRLKQLSTGSCDIPWELNENIFAAIVDHCPELEYLKGLGSDAIDESDTFVVSFKSSNRSHTSLRYLAVAYQFHVSWDEADSIQLKFGHLEIFPSLLELHVQVTMEERDTQTGWRDTAAIKEFRENATTFLTSQLERKKAMNRIEGKGETELVASLNITNKEDPGVFIEEKMCL
ncbi:hypothetical protein CYLTODRAFT_443024 [Cylindrobasidium torrendii FP15055 ss-10]|uniref:F-box domain-containing protein n=1 Tax=Cylindrobasidium torrendii FP15055 ss-10 TaxID=1314674 RepID=A0A0D7BEN2_9AGAR|nr:hypothetical protein CYLTODRAFT_443024 [Cylindrobasidium torrendii FP15055 ss-10]